MIVRLPVTEEQVAKAIELRDKLVRMAQDIEDQYGALVQLHRIEANGERQMLLQMPHLGGYVTQTHAAAAVIGQQKDRWPDEEGVTYQLVGEGNDKFVMAAVKS